MKLLLNPKSLADYQTFLRVKRLPVYRIRGRVAEFPDEYAADLGIVPAASSPFSYTPSPFLFDYQRDIASLAIRKRKFALFMDCGLGKTLVYFEFIRAALAALNNQKGALILSPPMVVEQTRDEYWKFYGDNMPIERVGSGDVSLWLKNCAGKVGITNFEAFRNPIDRGQLGVLAVDESDILASHYGKYGQGIVALGKGLEWKIGGTGTPAPNDRIEYALNAVFLDQYPTVNSFLAKFFVNRGQTQERWVLKPHALEPFYRSLSHWSIFLSNPATYGWKDNCGSIPEVHVHIHDVEMTPEQSAEVSKVTGGLFAANPGGITKRSALSRIAKGIGGIPTRKYRYIKALTQRWPNESTIIWCWFNEEQAELERVFPDAASIQGSTNHARRLELIADFKAGRRKVLISKPDVLGKGLNLQIATRQIFSSLIDSYRDYYQAVKRSNRIGSTKPLNVHIPVLDCERPMIENVLRKARLVLSDTAEQERIFKKAYTGESMEGEVCTFDD
jgi:hypothetical protein